MKQNEPSNVYGRKNIIEKVFRAIHVQNTNYNLSYFNERPPNNSKITVHQNNSNYNFYPVFHSMLFSNGIIYSIFPIKNYQYMALKK